MYFTQRVNIDQLYNIAINDTGGAYDPLTKLRSRTFYGRPDFKLIYSRIQSVVESGTLLGPREADAEFRVGVSLLRHLIHPKSCKSFLTAFITRYGLVIQDLLLWGKLILHRHGMPFLGNLYT